MKAIRRWFIFSLAFALLMVCCGAPTGLADEEKANAALCEGEALSWRYLDNPYDLDFIQDTAWTLPGYDDSRWPTGSGAFGAHNGQLVSVEDMDAPDIYLRHYLPNGETIPVYYFRLAFTPESLNDPQYKATIIFDDAVIVYLNGKPIYENNVPENGYPQPDSYGADQVYSHLPKDELVLDTGLLLPGENVLAVELHQANASSSDIYFSLSPFVSCAQEMNEMRRNSLCLGLGEEEGQLYVTWQGAGDSGRVEFAHQSNSYYNFPTAVQAELIYENAWGAKTFRALLSGLEPGETYAYRVIDAEPSENYSFTMPEKGDFCFMVNGDPQISDSHDSAPIEVYDTLLSAAIGEDSPAFLLTLGDQSDVYDDESLFLRYLSSAHVKSLPVAAVVGNHEDYSDVFSRFFTLPHMDEDSLGHSGDMSGDYWFGHEGLLMLCINSNNEDMGEHVNALRAFKEAYTDQYGEPRWIAAAFHHSLYSVGSHAASDSIQQRRDDYIPLLEELGVDVVFAGHDHRYVRTYPISDQTIIEDSSDHLVNPEGIVYLTLGSSTDTKYHEDDSDFYDYDLVVAHEDEPAVTRVDVSDHTFSVTTYCQTDDGIEVLDAFTIEKTGL